MSYSHDFTYERADGETIEVLLDDMVVKFYGNGWDEPHTVECEDYDLILNGTEVKYMNAGIVSRTWPLAPEDYDDFHKVLEREIQDYLEKAEPDDGHDDYGD